jgi:TonB family protein
MIAAAVSAVSTGVDGGVSWGTDDGSAGGVLSGETGGQPGGVIGGVAGLEPPDHMIHIARDKPLPMFPLSQVYPAYPEFARLNAWEDDLVVRYIIGKDGRIRDVQVLKRPQHEVFIEGTVRAISHWRFKPLIRDGERQEVVHELTIQYRLSQEG